VHHGIKLANLLTNTTGEVKIADFSIYKVPVPAISARSTWIPPPT
jgi:serine/threonine protein kinase